MGIKQYIVFVVVVVVAQSEWTVAPLHDPWRSQISTAVGCWHSCGRLSWLNSQLSNAR